MLQTIWQTFLETWPLWILALILTVVLAIVVGDVWIIASGRPSVSHRVIHWLWCNPGIGYVIVGGLCSAVAWIAGVATGHLVWPQNMPHHH